MGSAEEELQTNQGELGPAARLLLEAFLDCVPIDGWARGSGSAYSIMDPAAPWPAWYRVVEFTGAGRGDQTPAFKAREAASGQRTRQRLP